MYVEHYGVKTAYQLYKMFIYQYYYNKGAFALRPLHRHAVLCIIYVLCRVVFVCLYEF
jgi:hypothetical protein